MIIIINDNYYVKNDVAMPFRRNNDVIITQSVWACHPWGNMLTTCTISVSRNDRTCRTLQHVNTLRPRRNRRHFADDIFKCIFLNENVLISIKISLKFVPYGPINNIPTLVQIMAWCRPGDKPLSEPMMISSLTHICVARPQWVKGFNALYLYGRCHVEAILSVRSSINHNHKSRRLYIN